MINKNLKKISMLSNQKQSFEKDMNVYRSMSSIFIKIKNI